MRSPRLVSTAFAAMAILWAAPSASLDWAGRVGAGYTQTDEWSPGFHRMSPSLDLNLGLDLGGFIYRPGVLDYSGSFDARRISESGSDGQDLARDYLNYRARLTLFGNPRAPLSVSGYAMRSDDRFSGGDASSIGFRGISRNLGADLRYRQVGRPTLNLGYSRLDTESTSTLVADRRRVDSYTASTSMGSQGFSYSASYAGLSSDGLYAGDTFTDHRVDAFVAGNVSEETEARVAEAYYLRTPNVSSPFAPRQELNSLQAFLTNRVSGPDLQRGTYSYSHGLQSVPGTEELERTSHRAGYSVQRTLGPAWRLGTSLDAGYSENRSGATTRRDAGQGVAVSGSWTRSLSAGTLFISAGPRVGAVEPEGEEARFGWGASTSASVSHRRGNADYQAGYSISYSDDAGQEGTALSQGAQGSVQTPVGEALLRGQFSFSAQRRYGTPIGAGALRSMSLVGSYLWRTYALSATMSLTSGLSNAVADPGAGDGFFLSLPYDQHTFITTAQAAVQLTRRLGLSVTGRFGATDYPDRPAVTEVEGRTALSYGIGALRLNIEERYVLTHALGQTQRSNLFFVSAGRAFGSRY